MGSKDGFFSKEVPLHPFGKREGDKERSGTSDPIFPKEVQAESGKCLPIRMDGEIWKCTFAGLCSKGCEFKF